MCARRFLIIVFILILLAVAGAFAFFQWGDRVLAQQAMPTVEFVEPEPEPEGRYAGTDLWLLRPGIDAPDLTFEPEFEQAEDDVTASEEIDDATLDETVDPDGDLPEGVEAALPPVPTFYVHPTTYLKRDRWNAPTTLDGGERKRTDLFVRSQASIFAGVGPVWAPRYRQAAFGAFLSREPDALKALDVAYRDVEEAFEQFLEENPSGPIIVAGHSQGALHVLHLLSAHGATIKDRLVAAYVVGWPIDREADLPATGLPVCEGREQAGCIMTWLSFGDPPNANLVLRDWAKGDGYAEINRNRDRLVCTNPLNGGSADEADAVDDTGSLVPNADLTGGDLVAGLVSARCEEGLLLVNGGLDRYTSFVLPGNNYHVFDYALFWQPVRDDALARVRAWAS